MRPKKSHSRRSSHSSISGWIIVLTIMIGIISGFIFIFAISLNSDIEILPPPKQATVFYDINKKEYTRIYVENRLEIPYQKIPEKLKDAFINVEDARFFDHSGIDLRAIARALWVDIKGGGYIEGGSTITQQLARNILLTQRKAITRKIQEVFLAMKIERNYTKEEILERYLNQIYFGHGAYGVEAASRMYFGKSVTRLELHQMALLAGLPKNPNGYSPYVNPTRALERRAVVLSQMAKYGTISASQAEMYKKKPLDVIPLSVSKRKAAYFIDYIIHKLDGIIDEESLYTGGYHIYTTIDPLAQEAATEAVATLSGGTPDSRGVLQPQIALVAIDPRTGYIKAMIGGRDFANTQLNRAVSAYRQPGSTMKTFVYTAAIDSKQYTPNTTVVDEPVSYPSANGGAPWTPQNYDKIYRGRISLRQALEQSVNSVTIKLVENLGPSKIVSYARQMGLRSLVVSGPSNDLNLASLALGGLTKGVTPLELATAYTPLANKGIGVEPIAVLEVQDADGNVLYEDHPHKRVAISEDTAYIITDMLRGVIMRGTGQRAMIDRPAAGKTGTTNDSTNAWFVGYTPELLATVWIGNDSQNKPVTINGAVIGSGRAAEIWSIFMRKALSKTPPSDFLPPAGTGVELQICSESGQLATSNCPDVKYETFAPGTEPTQRCRIHRESSNEDINDNPVPNPSHPVPNSGDNEMSHPAWHNPIQPKPPQTPAQPPQAHASKRRKIDVKICTESGLLATPNCPDSVIVTETFVEGEEPRSYCNIHR